MRFKVTVFVALFGFAALAANPIHVFKNNSASIISREVNEVNGCVYGIGKERIKGKSELAIQTARSKSELKAKADLIENEVLSKVVWPAGMPVNKIKETIAFVKRHGTYSHQGSLRFTVSVLSKINGNICTSIVGCEKKNIRISEYADYASVKKTIHDYREAKRRYAEAKRKAEIKAKQKRLETQPKAMMAVTNAPVKRVEAQVRPQLPAAPYKVAVAITNALVKRAGAKVKSQPPADLPIAAETVTNAPVKAVKIVPAVKSERPVQDKPSQKKPVSSKKNYKVLMDNGDNDDLFF